MRRWWPVMLLAFIVGSLFRWYQESHVGFFRMFGTLGIVVLGILATRLIVEAQLREGGRRLQEVLSGLGPGWRVTPLGRPSGPSWRDWEYRVEGSGGTWVVTCCPAAGYSRGRSLARQLSRAQQRARALAAACPGAVPVVVLLRRRSDDLPAEGAGGVRLVDLEALPRLLAGGPAPAPAGDPAAAEA